MSSINNSYYVLTGGPGSGKSTVLEILGDMGYNTVKEVARSIIQNQIKTNGDALPWGNTIRYAHLMLLHSIIDFEEFFHINAPCFFDRGIIDTLGYSRLINIPIASEIIKAAQKYRYNPKVFLFPFWKEIYRTDTERKQEEEEAIRTYFELKKTHEEFNYQPIIVPRMPPEERAEWVLSHIE